MKIHFTDAAVRRLKLPAGKSQVDYFETIVPGRSLVLTLNAGGRNSWSVLFYHTASRAPQARLVRLQRRRLPRAQRQAGAPGGDRLRRAGLLELGQGRQLPASG